MVRNGVCAALLACAVAGAVASPAAAAQRKGDGLRQCFGDEISLEEMQMQCVKAPGGEWEAIDHDSAVTTGFAMFFFFAILLGLLPGFIGGTMSKDAGVPWPAGFAIGLFGSWIGVIGLYLFGQSRKQGTPVIQTGVKRSSPHATGAGSTAAERLKTLKDLLDQGLITQAEYDEGRAKTIEGL